MLLLSRSCLSNSVILRESLDLTTSTNTSQTLPFALYPLVLPVFARSALRAALRTHTPLVVFVACGMATAQPAILNRDMGKNQWYVHLSREEGASLDTIKAALQETRADCAAVNLTIGVGPGLLPELSPSEVPVDFSCYPWR